MQGGIEEKSGPFAESCCICLWNTASPGEHPKMMYKTKQINSTTIVTSDRILIVLTSIIVRLFLLVLSLSSTQPSVKILLKQQWPHTNKTQNS